MSYEDLEEARAKRAAKEKTSWGKGKRGRKRKSAELELGVPEPETEVTRMSEIPRAKEGASSANVLGRCQSISIALKEP
jgi:hypothetical protein